MSFHFPICTCILANNECTGFGTVPVWDVWPVAVPGSVLMEFRNAITITNEEETKMGIPENYQGRSAIAQEVYDVRRLHQLPTIRDTHGDSPGLKPRRTPPSSYLFPIRFSLQVQHTDILSSQPRDDSDDVFVD